MSRGRPIKVDPELIAERLIEHKDEICVSEKSIISERNSVWATMSAELQNKIQPSTLYSYVVNNRYKLRNVLFNIPDQVQHLPIASHDVTDESMTSDDEKSTFVFTLTFPKAQFENLIVVAAKNYVDKKGKPRTRIINVLQPEKWTEIMSKKIYDEFRLPHGYHFQYNYINRDRGSGGFTGHCKCGSQLKCCILPSLEESNIVKIECTASKGTKQCGKRQCRGETRVQTVAQLDVQSVEVYRASSAAVLMEEGDNFEPPHLYNANVLRTAKHAAMQKKWRDADSIVALSKLKRAPEGRNVVRDIGVDPVFVHFWSPHQVRLYNETIKKEHVAMCIDATGGIVKRYTHVDGTKSQHIFLYLNVGHCSWGSFTVASMFSEHQDTVTIENWLNRIVQSGVKSPKEVICDSSKALLNACCSAFTGHKTIQQYVEACMFGEIPAIYLRIDVAHYLKNWADFLSKEKKQIKTFYLFAVGQLILSINKDDAAKIIEALLLVSLTEYAGEEAESLKNAVAFIKMLVCKEKNNTISDIIESGVEANDGNTASVYEEETEEYYDRNNEHLLAKWAASIMTSVESTINKENGDDINPRHCPAFAKRLMKQIETIPMWSSVCWSKFGYGRIPASSAPVESTFKTLKQQVIQDYTRLDIATESLIKYNKGKLKLIECSTRVIRKRKYSSSSDEQVQNQENMGNTFNETILQDLLPSQRSPLQNLSPIRNRQSQCVACANNDYPTGVHKCILCDANVHTLEGCSVSIEDDEGYGERRLCLLCKETSGAEDRIALNEVENWRNLGHSTEKQPKSKYLNKADQETLDVFTNQRKLPILKNGNSVNFQYITIGEAKLSFTNTCGFDSIFQIILAIASDFPNLRQYFKENKDTNELFAMVLETLDKQLNRKTYKTRGEILLKYLNKKPQASTIEEVDCACNAVSLVNFLFKRTPSFKEKIVCPRGCDTRINSFATITIVEKELKKPLGSIIKEHVALPGVKCQRCQQIQQNEVEHVGEIAILGVDITSSVTLDSIPKKFKSPKSEDTYSLFAIVDYKGPIITRKSLSIGHYTAIIRRNTRWVLYDDLQEKTTIRKTSFKANPELLFYIKEINKQ